jgi:hypothetical protein
MNDNINTKASKEKDKDKGKVYLILVDGQEYTFDHSPVTGREIMDAANIPYGDGLLLINEDGTQEPIGLDDEVELKPGRSVVRAPKFKRG